MCFYIEKTGINSRPRIADKDIQCYKVVYAGSTDNIIVSKHHKYVYEINRLYKLNHELRPYTSPKSLSNISSIDEGFHSYTKLRVVLDTDYYKLMTIVKCIIPKGSTYYLNNKDEEYVSDQIIIKEIIYNR